MRMAKRIRSKDLEKILSQHSDDIKTFNLKELSHLKDNAINASLIDYATIQHDYMVQLWACSYQTRREEIFSGRMTPLYFTIYLDKKLNPRAYIPKLNNGINPVNKKILGSDLVPDIEYICSTGVHGTNSAIETYYESFINGSLSLASLSSTIRGLGLYPEDYINKRKIKREISSSFIVTDKEFVQKGFKKKKVKNNTRDSIVNNFFFTPSLGVNNFSRRVVTPF